jgi:4-amino-4-deoxy-L-arabinose transferase-like glycosyltransferase
MFMGTTWLMYRLAALLFGPRAGLWSAVSLNLILFFSLGAGGWILPDGPLLLFSAAAALCLARATLGSDVPGRAEGAPPSPAAARRTLPWMGFGVFSGLGLLSKYHAAFVLAGAGLFLATSKRQRGWLRRPEPYLAALLAAIVFLPVLVWNARNDWASIRFQGGRAVPLASDPNPFLGAMAGQAAWLLPWFWIPLLVVLASALRRGPDDIRRWLLCCLGAGPVLFFALVTAFGTRGLPHWSAPGYFMLIPLLGEAIERGLGRGDRWTRRWLMASAAGFALVVAILASHVSNGWIARAAPRLLSGDDPTDDVLQWRAVAEQLGRWGYPRPDVAIAGAQWTDAAKLGYALGPGVTVASVGDDPRGFEFVRSQASLVGQDVLLVARRRARRGEPFMAYAPYFARIEPLGTIPILRGRVESVAVSVYLGRRLLRPVPPRRTRATVPPSN